MISTDSVKTVHVVDPGISEYPFDFRIINAATLRVVNVINGNMNLLVLNEHYQITGIGQAAGTVEILPDADGNYLQTGILLIRRISPATQLENFREFSNYPAAEFELAIDRAIMILAELQEESSRAIKGAVEDAALDMTLPAAATRAGRYLGFSTTGKPIAVDGLDDSIMATLLGETLIQCETSGEMMDVLQVTALMKTLLLCSTLSSAQTVLGISGFIKTLLDDADAGAALSTLGVSDFAKTILDDTTAEAIIATLGLDERYYPAGITYKQYPGKKSPDELGLPGTWSNISSEFAGDFFRAEGGNASAFGSGEQAHMFQTHVHKHRHSLGKGPWGGGGGMTVQPGINNSYGTMYTDYTEAAPSTGNPGIESRPVNQTFRLWEKDDAVA